jgi:hypothetical protein
MKLRLLIAALLFIPLPLFAQGISQLQQFIATTSPYSAIAPLTHGKNIYAPFSSATTSSSYANKFCIGNTSPDCITAWPTGSGGGAAFPFTPTNFGSTNANSTSTLIGFTQGIYALASSTIGNGSQTGGLTVSGGATTTGNAYIAGSVGVGAQPAAGFAINVAGFGRIIGSGTGVTPDINASLSLQRTDSPYNFLEILNNGGTGKGAFFGLEDNDFTLYSYQGGDTIFYNDNDETARFTNGGNVGIGTTSPYAKLSVHANDGDTNRLLFAIGSSTASAITTLFSVSNTGKVAIGTTTQPTQSAQLLLGGSATIPARLALTGLAADGGTAGGPNEGVYLQLTHNGAGNRQVMIAATDDAIDSLNAAFRIALIGGNAYMDAISTDGSTHKTLVLGNSGGGVILTGNVGVGTGIPSYLFDAKKSGGTGTVIGSFGDTSNNTRISFYPFDTKIEAFKSGDFGTTLQFNLGGFTVTDSGNTGNTLFSYDASGLHANNITSAGIAGNTYNALVLTSNLFGVSTVVPAINLTTYDTIGNTDKLSKLAIYNGSDGRIVLQGQSTGNVGIATTSPFAKLSVHANNGDTNTTLFAIGSSTQSATSTLFSVSNTGAASTTKFFGAGLANCTSNNVLTWTGGLFGCEADDSGTGGGSFPFAADTNYGQVAYSTSTPTLWFKSGLYASSTSQFAFASTTAISAVNAYLTKLGNLPTNGFVKTSGSDGTLSIDTATYLTTVDISANTNLGVTWPITLTGDTLGFNGLSTSTAIAAGAAALYATGVNTVASVATSTPTISSGLAYSGTMGNVLGGSSGNLTCNTASGTVFGCLSASNWLAFNNKIATGTNFVSSNMPYWGADGTLYNVATGTVSSSGLVAVTAGRSAIGGALAISLSNINANTLVGNNTGASAAPTSFATSSMFGVSTPGYILANTDTGLRLVASTTYAAGAGISVAFNNNTLTITNTGASFGFPFTAGTAFGSNVNSTSTIVGFTAGLQASSTVRFGNLGVSSQFVWDSTTGRLGIGSSTPWATLSVAATSYNYLQPLFAISTSTDRFGNLMSISATTTTLANILGQHDSGIRMLVGTSTTYQGGMMLDQMFLEGRINTGEWSQVICDATMGPTITQNSDLVSACGNWSFQEDNNSSLFNASPVNGYPTIQLNNGGTTAADGAGLFATGLAMTMQAVTPVLETVGRIGQPMSTSTYYAIGFTNINPQGTTFETAPTAGCYFIASSTEANWKAVCGTTAANSTIVDTGFASTTSQSQGSNEFNRFRIEADNTHARFYMASPSLPMRLVADISTNYPASTNIGAGVFFGRTGAISGSIGTGWIITSARAWFRSNVLPQ